MYIIYNDKNKIMAMSSYILEMFGINSLSSFVEKIGDINKKFSKCDSLLLDNNNHYTQALKYGSVDNKVYIKIINKHIGFSISVDDIVSYDEMLTMVKFSKINESIEFDKAAMTKSKQIGVTLQEYKESLLGLITEYKLFVTSDLLSKHELLNIAKYLKLDKITLLLQKINTEIDIKNTQNAKAIAKTVEDYFKTLEKLIKGNN